MLRITPSSLAALGAWVLVAVGSPSAAAVAAGLTLARDGRPTATIVTAPDPPRTVEFAARELQYHVRKITGATLPIADAAGPVTGPRILIGDSAATRKLGLRGRAFRPQEYLIRFLPDALVLIGRDGTGSGIGPGPAVTRVEGRFGRAVSFDGERDALTIPDTGFSDEAGTLECWVWLPGRPRDREETILRLDGTGTWTYHILRTVPGTRHLAYVTYDGAAVTGVETAADCAEGWHHIIATHDQAAGVIELFVDGVSAGTAKFNRSTCASSGMAIGGMAASLYGGATTGNPFLGLIDEVRVSKVVRRPGSDAAGGPYEPDAATTLLLHFDEAKGSVRDASGHAILDPPSPYDANGSLYAVYDFLERFCGVRWYAPTEIGLACPSTPTLTVRGADVRRAPAMRWRWITPATLLWRPFGDPIPNGDAALWRLRMRIGGEDFWCCHSFYGYYDRFWQQNAGSPGLFEGAHPDWFAQGYEGQPPQMCYTNPGFIAQVVKDAGDYFDGDGARPGATATGPYFGLVPMDNMSWCHCPACQARLDPAEAGNPQFSNGKASDYIFGFVNEVARAVGKTHPGKWISALAYSDYAYYPKTVKLEPNVLVQMCLHTRNWWCPSMERNDRKVLGTWVVREGGRRPLYLWLYYCFPALSGTYDKYEVFPGFFAHTVVRQMEMYRRAGIKGIFMEHSAEFSQSFLGDQLELYVTLRLADDPTLDGNRLIEEFFPRYYGAAAAPMRELYLAIEDTYSNPRRYPPEIQRSPGHHHQTEDLAWGWLGTPERMARFGKLMEAARAASRTDTERARVALFERGVWEPMTRGAAAHAERVRLRSAAPPKLTVPRVPDAGGDPARVDWSKAAPTGKWALVTGDAADRALGASLAHDGAFLYVRLEDACDPARLVAGKAVWDGDDWELFFAAKREKPYRQLCVGPEGAIAGLGWAQGQAAWDSGARVVSDRATPGRWVVMVAAPLAKLLPGGVAPGASFYANLYRSATEPKALYAWSPNLTASFHELGRMAELKLE